MTHDPKRMRTFDDETGALWTATALEESTSRHHGRWYLVFHPENEPGRPLAMPEVRWKNRPTAQRTLKTMSLFELRRRLGTVRSRYQDGTAGTDDQGFG